MAEPYLTGASLGQILVAIDDTAGSRISPKQEVIMRGIVASLSAVLMLIAVTAVAQDKTKSPSKSGHEGMTRSG